MLAEDEQRRKQEVQVLMETLMLEMMEQFSWKGPFGVTCLVTVVYSGRWQSATKASEASRIEAELEAQHIG